jgi:hypothetical protein
LAQRFIRGVLIGIAAIFLLMLESPVRALLSSGTRGVRGYVEHVALQGVDLTSQKPSDVARLLRDAQERFLIIDGMLAALIAGLFALDRLIARKLASSEHVVSRTRDGT